MDFGEIIVIVVFVFYFLDVFILVKIFKIGRWILGWINWLFNSGVCKFCGCCECVFNVGFKCWEFRIGVIV